MKLRNIRILIGIFLFAGIFVPDAFAQEQPFEGIADVLKTGSSKELVTYLSKAIELNLDGEEASYSKAQAAGVLKSFFSKYPATNFEINHEGASKSGLLYAIGQYTYKDGSFRVWIRLKGLDEDYKIHEMSFIKE